MLVIGTLFVGSGAGDTGIEVAIFGVAELTGTTGIVLALDGAGGCAVAGFKIGATTGFGALG